LQFKCATLLLLRSPANTDSGQPRGSAWGHCFTGGRTFTKCQPRSIKMHLVEALSLSDTYTTTSCMVYNTGHLYIQCVHEKTALLSIMVYSKYLADIIEIFTTEFSIYLYIVCKNSWKFNVKIVFYYMFSITRSKHKFP